MTADGVALLDTGAALHAIEPEWTALWRRAGSPPFQSPAWLLPWWHAFGTNYPRVAALRTGGVLVGLLPMYRLDTGCERKLLPIGIGVTDYIDALIDPDAPPAAAGFMLQALLDHAQEDGVTSCTLPDLPPGAALRTASLPQSWHEQALPPTVCPVLPLPRRADELRATIPSGMLRNIRQSRHRADRAGGWRAEIAASADCLPLWHTLTSMHQHRWTQRGEPGGVLADPNVLAFHALAVPKLAACNILRLYVLHIAGQVAALYHTMAAPGRLLFYLSAYDATVTAISPGTLLLAHIVEQAIAEGMNELHFLRGGESYKYAWGAIDRLSESRLLLPVSPALR